MNPTESPLLSIKAVAQRTGLSPHVIRIWEKRYGVVRPNRTGTNRRRYTEQEAAHLALLARLTREGHAIGELAALPPEKLGQMLPGHTTPDRAAAPAGLVHLAAGIEAVRRHDQAGLEEALERAEVALGLQGMLMQVASPLAQSLGELWREGSLSAAHEHFASAVLRAVLTRACRAQATGPHAPVLIVATPAGQVHELGALLAAVAAANLGWKVIYLGANLPAADIAGAARQHQARAVGLSVVYPEDDPALGAELATLRRQLPESTAILAGGRALPSYARELAAVGALAAQDLAQLGTLLEGLRRGR